MPKTDINTIFKNGKSTKIVVVDYSSDSKEKELKDLHKKREIILQNKQVDVQKLGSFIIKK